MASYSKLAGTAFTLANLALLVMILNPGGTTKALNAKTSRGRRQRKQGRSSVLGGYQSIPVQDEDVVAAANFAFETLRSGTLDYYISSAATSYKLLTASEQVVSGVNIKMQMTFVDSSGDCLGAATVVVYDRFGEKSITSYDYIENGCFVLLGTRRDKDTDSSTDVTDRDSMSSLLDSMSTLSLIKELSVSSQLSNL